MFVLPLGANGEVLKQPVLVSIGTQKGTAEVQLGEVFSEAYKVDANAKDDALKWLRQLLGMSAALVLNVAGPRESKAPGIQARTKAFLEALLLEA